MKSAAPLVVALGGLVVAAIGLGQQPKQPPTVSTSQIQKRVPAGVIFEPDIAYREGNPKWKLDLFRPAAQGSARRAGLVFVHGGGWRGGDKRTGTFLNGAIEYAEAGYVAITVNYRLTEEAPFPACVEDVKCAVRWLRANAGKYNVDPERIGGYGNSAGAHLVSMLGLAGKEAGLEGDGPYQNQSSMLQAVCASATPTDLTNWRDGQPMRQPSGAGLLAGPEAGLMERARRASPITWVRKDAPPFLLIHGTADRTVPIEQSERLANALREAGGKVSLMIFDNEGHGVFTSQGLLTRAAMRAFFDEALRGGAAGSGAFRGEADRGQLDEPGLVVAR